MAFISSKKSFLKAAAKGDMAELLYCLSALVPGNFSVDVKNGSGKTALYLAAESGQLDAVKALVEAKADLNISDGDGKTPLHIAITNDKTAVARFLIASGADVNTHTTSYVSPLLTAARYGQLDVVKDLVSAGADLNAVSKETGRTALHWAVINGHGPVVEFLMASHARTDIADRDNKTPADHARDKRTDRLLNIITAAAKQKAPQAETSPAEDGDSWKLMGAARVAHIADYPSMGRRITEIFNFENRERVIIAENLKTGAESLAQPEKFETLGEEVVGRAEDRLKSLGGQPPERGQKKAFNL